MVCKYDLIFSLGAVCACTESLRYAGLQFSSFPFDWLAGSTLPRRTDILVDGCDSWLRAEDLRFVRSETAIKTDAYFNKATGITFNHDFPAGVPIAESIAGVREKYDRRFARLRNLIGRGGRILAVYLTQPAHPVPSPEDAAYCRRRLSERFPGATFDVLVLAHRENAAQQVERPSDGVTFCTFDYLNRQKWMKQKMMADPMTVGEWLKREYAVKDYRTRKERARWRERQRKEEFARFAATGWFGYCLAKLRYYRSEEYRKKYELYGAKTFVGYRFRRLYLDVAVWFPFPSIVLAWFRRRRYRWILPVGINCEAAFRFYRKWGFVESSLLGWAATSDLERTLRVLKGLDALLAGEVRYEGVSRMWRCLNTGACFHGKLKFGAEPSEAEKAADLQDLRGRMAHLKEKFLSSIRERPLLIHRLANSDAQRDDLAACLDAFEEALRDLGARDYTLLVICERRFLGRMPSGPNRIFRTVRKFNPPDRNIDVHAGDTPGWRAIFTEFAPAKILPKRHAFKFE